MKDDCWNNAFDDDDDDDDLKLRFFLTIINIYYKRKV